MAEHHVLARQVAIGAAPIVDVLDGHQNPRPFELRREALADLHGVVRGGLVVHAPPLAGGQSDAVDLLLGAQIDLSRNGGHQPIEGLGVDEAGEIVGVAWADHQGLEVVFVEGWPVLGLDDIEAVEAELLGDGALLVEGQLGVGAEIDLPQPLLEALLGGLGEGERRGRSRCDAGCGS